MIEHFSNLVEAYGAIAIFSSFIIGVLTSLAPCSIAAIPLIVGFAANSNLEENSELRSKFIRNFTLIFTLGVVISITLLFVVMTQFKYIINSSPIFGYTLAGLLSFYVGLSGFGVLKGISFHGLARKFVKFELYGALLMGILIGVVSTPCASPAIASILIVAQKQNFLYSFILVMAFALGHSVILIISGLSINFVESVLQKKSISYITNVIQKVTALFLIIVAFYFFNRVYVLGTL